MMGAERPAAPRGRSRNCERIANCASNAAGSYLDTPVRDAAGQEMCARQRVA